MGRDKLLELAAIEEALSDWLWERRGTDYPEHLAIDAMKRADALRAMAGEQ